MGKFEIKYIHGSTHDSSFGGIPWKVTVLVEMDSKSWAKTKKRGDLGHLYGVAISNAVYNINRNIPASCPTVDDRKRASKGIKRITLTYFVRSPLKAQSLGFTVREINGEAYPRYADSVSLYHAA